MMLFRSSSPASGRDAFRYFPVLAGICAGAFYCLIDVLVDVFLFGRGTLAGQILHPTIHEVWIRVFALCMIVSSGFVVSFMATRRKQIEEELTIVRNRMQDDHVLSEGILDAVADGVSIQGLDYRILYQNKAHRSVLGDHLGKFCYEAYEKQPSVCADCPLSRTFADGGVHTEVRTAAIGGVTRYFEITASPLADMNGRVIAGIEAVREITARMQAEKLLRESEQKFRTLFEESKDVFYISTMEGKFLDINPAGVGLFGYASKEELLQADIGRDIYVNPQDRKRFVDFVHRTNYAKDYEVLMKRKNGEKLVVIITSTALHDQHGEVTGFRGVIRDVTEYKKLQQQLLQSQKMKAIGLLAGGIAHDFNNILTAISGYGNLLKKSLNGDGSAQEYLEQILEAASRASRLTYSILAFSRKQILKPEPVDLNEIIGRVEKFLAYLIGEDIVLKAVLHGADMTIMADSAQIEQVLINLATNARDAMPAGGSLVIETSVERLDEEHALAYGLRGPGSFAAVTVTDTGKGFDEETQERIFEPFFTTKEAGKGTGLGLSIVHGIIRQHGGHIMVESASGRGSKFKIYLPLVQAKPGKATAVKSEPATGGTATLLIAEDDGTVRVLLRRMLEGAGYRILEASTGEDAIRTYYQDSDRIELLILDVVMPDRNGKDVYDEIRGMHPNIKALFISGYTADIIHKKGIFDPALDFLRKPLSEEELLRKVHEILSRRLTPSERPGG